MRRTRHERALGTGDGPAHAIIDIGSNTVRMVAYAGAPRAPTVILNEKVAARLGRELNQTGRMPDTGVAQALAGLARFRLLLDGLGITDITTVATAAPREAANGPEFIAAVERLGLAPRVLSGEEEARASALGVLGAFPGAAGIVADLGGGSLELIEIGDDRIGQGVSLPLGTLRLPPLIASHGDLKRPVAKALRDAGWDDPRGGTLYLVGGTWRAMAAYALDRIRSPLTDPHGAAIGAAEAVELAAELARADPAALRKQPRISSMRAAILPDAARLLQELLKRLQPERLIVSSWGLREGLLFERLPEAARRQDPLIAGVAHFAAQRGCSPTLAARVAGWTAASSTPGQRGSERLRLAATMLALASMQVEPNLRTHQGIDWALHKRWLAVSPAGRAMLAATLCANGNQLEMMDLFGGLASAEQLESAIIWGLSIRLCRRLGACSRASLEGSALVVEDGTLRLTVTEELAALAGPQSQKDLALLAARMGLDPIIDVTAGGQDFHKV